MNLWVEAETTTRRDVPQWNANDNFVRRIRISGAHGAHTRRNQQKSKA
jgi:hypothetical protein